MSAAAISFQAATRLATRRTPTVGAFRQFIRSLEPPTSPRPIHGSQRGDWSQIVKTRGQQAVIYFPGLALVLGWPLIAQKLVDGRMGDL